MPLATLALVPLLMVAGPAAVPDASVLLTAEAEFMKASHERGLEGWLDHFAPDAAVFPSDRPPVEGIEAISAYYREISFDPRVLDWTPLHAELAASGDLGYTWGTWQSRRTAADGREVVRTGKFSTVWRRQPTGRWKVVLDIGVTDVQKR